MPPFLEEIALFLLAAVIAVPIAQRLGLGSVLGFLIAGVVIGPWGLNLGPEAGDVWHAAEFGVVLLLFVIGIEMEPRRLWALRRAIFGVGGMQVGVSAIVLAAIAILVMGMSPSAGLVAGLALALSSTAFAIQLLAEQRQLRTHHGRSAFAILLFQDLAVVPILALLPLLSAGGADVTLLGALWQTAKIALVLAAIVVGGHYFLRPILRLIASTRIPEIFTSMALLIVIGVALVMSAAGLSLSLGAFVAGMLLADSEYRHQLEVAIAPFKGLLLGLFFIVVGMSINIGLILDEPLYLLAITLGLVVIKGAILYVLGRNSRLAVPTARKLAAILPQGGEFAFVILSAAMARGLFEQAQVDRLVAAVTLSMVLTPFLVKAVDWINGRRPGGKAAPPNDWSNMPEHPVIIAGFGRVGQIVGRMLRTYKIKFVALDNSPDRIDFVRKYGSKVFYGDATQLEVLRACGVAEARLFVLAIDNQEASLRCARTLRKHFPQLSIVARARNRNHAYALMELGVRVIHRETFQSSLDMAGDALKSLGVNPADAARAVKTFRMHDQERLFAAFGAADESARSARLGMQATKELEEQFERDDESPVRDNS